MRLEILDEFPPELDEVAERSPHASFYQTGVWINSLSRSFPSMVFRCIVAEQGGELLGYLPFFEISKGPGRFLWSMPFGTYGGPVALGGDDVRHALLNSFAKMGARLRVCEIGWVDYWNLGDDAFFRREEAITHLIDLEPGFDRIWSQVFEKSRRKRTRLAQREGVSVVESGSIEDARRYHAIYTARADAWGERFRYPENLFVELVGGGRNNVKLFLAYRGDQLLGGQLNFYFRDTVIAWYGITSLESRSFHASTLLYTSFIRHACENGYKLINLGGSLGKTSLMDFKVSLGGIPYRYRVFRKRTPIGRIATAIRRRRIRK